MFASAGMRRSPTICFPVKHEARLVTARLAVSLTSTAAETSPSTATYNVTTCSRLFVFFSKSGGGGDGNGNEYKHFTGNLSSSNGNRGNGGAVLPKPKIGRLPFLVAFYLEPSYFGPTTDNELAATGHAHPANCERSLPYPPWTFPPNHPGRSDQSRIPVPLGRTHYRTSARARMLNREGAHLDFDVIASGGRVRWDCSIG